AWLLATGSATGVPATGSAAGIRGTGSAAGVSATGSAAGIRANGPAAGLPTTGSAAGIPAAGSAAGIPATADSVLTATPTALWQDCQADQDSPKAPGVRGRRDGWQDGAGHEAGDHAFSEGPRLDAGGDGGPQPQAGFAAGLRGQAPAAGVPSTATRLPATARI